MSSLAAGHLFYRRLASPLHAARASVGAAWVATLAAAALLLFHPLALAALALAVLAAGAGAGVGRTLAGRLPFALLLTLPTVIVNVLVSRQGLTVFARLGDLGPFGQGNLTVEALAYGGVIALKVTLLILIATLASLAVDPDRLLGLLRRLSYRSALTASMATRMVPLLAADSARIAEAQRTRAHGAPAGARGRLALFGALIGGSLDRALDVAATLELRGFANARAASGRHAPLSRHDIAFLVSAAAILALSLLGRVGGAASFDAYPQLRAALTPATLALCAALVAAALAPFADRRGIEP